MISTFIWKFLCAGLTAVILWLSLLPSDTLPPIGFGWDKLNHAAAMSAVSVLAFLSVRNRRRAILAAFSYGMLLGVLIEICQALFTTTRSAEWHDLLADLIGTGLACGSLLIVQCRKEIS